VDEILIHWERCNACGECLKACVQEMQARGYPHPDVPRLHLPWEDPPVYIALCRQCCEPPCLDACVSGAIRVAPDGRVLLDDETCVGCWMCLAHCPFGAITAVAEKAVKCDLCAPVGAPPCVRACPEGALVLGPAEVDALARARERVAYMQRG
jgi:carbon-monoxide dehydrogenase iron sulfur subunit